MMPPSMVQRRLLIPLVLAAIFAGALATRTYRDFDRVRMRVVKEPVVAAAPYVAIDLPDLQALGGQPSALIIRVSGVADGSIAVALDGAPIGHVRVPAGQEVRRDLAFLPPAGPSQLVLTGPRSGWALTSLEISTIHGQSRGYVDFVIVPEGRRHAPGVPLW